MRGLSNRPRAAAQGKRIQDVAHRMHVAVPVPRDGVARPPVIPPGVAAARARRDAGEKRKTEKDLQARARPGRRGRPC